VTGAPLDPDRATSVTSAVASALAAIHATGMAHGNVHPGTVLIGSDGRVVLSDARSDESTTPDADVRAVGGVLYYALTGHWPHAEAGQSVLPDAVRDAGGTVVPPRQVRGGVPRHLSDLATDLLDPTVAPPSADVLSAHLTRLEGDREEAFFSTGGGLDFDQSGYSGPTGADRGRSVSKLVVGVAVLLVLSLAGLLLTIKALSEPGHPGGTAPTSAATSADAARAGGHPTPVRLRANRLRIVDPPPGTRSELDSAGAMIDGDQSTYWHTEHYNRPAFGDKKPGMGILINLGAPKAVTTVKISFANRGATVELRRGTALPPASAEGDDQVLKTYELIGQPQEAGSTTVLNSDGQPVQYLLVWISRLPPSVDDPDRYQVRIQEIEVSAE
jgi:hypothetical protein